MKVTPKRVSGRVVNTVTTGALPAPGPAAAAAGAAPSALQTGKSISAPSDLPIQLRCWVSTASGQPGSS